jgi:hypothetical protein
MDYGGNWSELQQRAIDQLLATQSKRIAEEFWTGAEARADGWDNRYLAHLASDVLSDSGAVSATVGLACLEQYLADCSGGEPGMIHAPRQVVTHWKALGLVTFENGLVRTVLQTIVVPDAGYDGSGPQQAVNGAPTPAVDGSIWAYATSPVEVRLGPVDAQPAPDSVWEVVDRDTNDFTVFAQRLAMVTFDNCCHAAVEMDLPLCGIGGAGS